VRAATKAFHEKSDKLNLLILNAGVIATPKGRTEDSFETQFSTNHLGHFLLFQLLKPDLLAASTPKFQSRVVVIASAGYRYGKVRFYNFNFEKDPYDP
jgi:NAD(P)-dependent dehydrogenase (short-subunit alcohol dehydrogenase family)